MIVEDIELEMKTSREEDAKAEAAYEEQKKALEDVLRSQKVSHVETKAELAELEEKIEGQQGLKMDTDASIEAEGDLKQTIYRDCSWVATHFKKRRSARKAELDGLAEAKSILAGVDAGDYDELAFSS